MNEIIINNIKKTVAGHSMGGGMAQLTSVILNKKDDPLGADLAVHKLYSLLLYAENLILVNIFSNV